MSCYATDVISNEQKDISKNPLVRFSKENDNLIITPHVAGLTYESESKAAEQSFITIEKYFRKK